MKLVSFLHEGAVHGGILDDYKIHPLPHSVLDFIVRGETIPPVDNTPSPL